VDPGLGDEGARVNALLSGDLDLVAAIDPRSVRRVEGAPGFAVFRACKGDTPRQPPQVNSARTEAIWSSVRPATSDRT